VNILKDDPNGITKKATMSIFSPGCSENPFEPSRPKDETVQKIVAENGTMSPKKPNVSAPKNYNRNFYWN